VGSIEIAQVRLTSNVAAAITAAELFAVTGTHKERYDFPLWSVVNEDATVEFDSALPAIHTGDVAKGVSASYADPIFAEVSEASDFVPSETSFSVSSTQIYNKTKGSKSSSLGQGAFTAYLADGVTDPLIGLKGEKIWFRFYPDRYKTPYILDQGTLGITRSFPAADSITAACTISAETAAIEKAS